MEELRAKASLLEERLAAKREALLEKTLVLEEVSALAEVSSLAEMSSSVDGGGADGERRR